MLAKLFVQNYALIKELNVEFENGLTIITGETGAGKSILLGALSLILGTRADTNVLLDKTEKCVVEGTFRISEYDLESFFNANDLDYESLAIVRREINPAGKTRAFINDTPVTLNILKELGEKLIDIHSQHQTLMLNDNAFQLNIIDSFAGTAHLKSQYSSGYARFRKLQKEFNEIKERAEKNRSDLEYYQFQMNQLEEAKLIKGEQSDLEKEQELLEHAAEIQSSLSSASMLFSSEERSVLSMLREAKVHISRISQYLADGGQLTVRLNSLYIELDDIAGEIDKYCSSIEADPARLSFINNRLDTLYSLFQKHHVKDLDELILKREEVKSFIRSVITGDERLEEVESLLKESEVSLRKLSEEISELRLKIIPEIEHKITGLLKLLGVPNAKFRILLSGTVDFTPSGTDNADFLFSANKQTDPENLARIASGGELSRVMLSLKSLLTKNNNLPTIIFDEIDSGVSGEVADKVGQILSGMGNYMQVINITHLPQVASRGSRHYHVYKEDTGDATITRVKLLSADERIIEVARLLSGSAVTETAIRNARELFNAGINQQ